MAFLYHIAIHLYYLIVLAVSPFNPKARSWIRGRLGWRSSLQEWRNPVDQVIWVHAASLGEFEQGRPLIDEIKTKYTEYKLLLTFFSPSGFEIRKNYPGADHVMYLPLDTCYNARRFVKLVNPAAVFFIKYEFWYNHLRQLRSEHHPVYLISAIFRPGQVFFKWFGSWYKKSLAFIDFFFVQDESSKSLLKQAGLSNCTVSGDTRFDRVIKVAGSAKDVPLARIFAEGRYCVVAGSTWPEDEEFLSRYINESAKDTCFIIAPHEISEAHLNRLILRLARISVLFSKASVDTVHEAQVLIIDNIGLLSSLYRYSRVAYIGGGFGKGIHNILEAAAFGIPVIFGPNYHKFREARELIALGSAYSIRNSGELTSVLEMFRFNRERYNISSQISTNYVHNNTGATTIILNHVFKKLQNLHD